MNTYERLQDEACEDGIDVIDYTFHSNRIKGLYCDGVVAIREDMTIPAKTCALAAELQKMVEHVPAVEEWRRIKMSLWRFGR